MLMPMPAQVPAPSAALKLKIYGEQLRLLVRQRVDLPVNLVVAAVVSKLAWPLLPHTLILFWFCAFCLVIMGRAVCRRRFRTAVLDATDVRRWAGIFTANALVTALLWGATGVTLLFTDNPEFRIFIIFVLGGLMAAGMVTNSVLLPTMFAFQIPTILPIIIILFSRFDSISMAMATMLTSFAVVLINTGRGINSSIVDSLRLRFEFEILLDERSRESAAATMLASIVNASDDAIVSETATGEIISWNHGAERTFGYTAAEMVGSNARILLPAERRLELQQKRNMLVAGAHIEPFDTERLCKDGSRVAVSMSVSPNTDSEGHSSGGSFIARSITERLKADKALIYRDRLMHAATLAAAMLVKSDAFATTMPAALRILGETLDVDRVLMMQHHPALHVVYSWQLSSAQPGLEKAAGVDAFFSSPESSAWRSAIDGGETLIVQRSTSTGAMGALLARAGTESVLAVPIIAGTERWGELGIESCRAVREWTAYEIDTLKIFCEIAGSLIVHQQTALALSESLERFQNVTTAAQDGIVTIGPTNRIELWNPAAQRMLGYTAAEAIGRPAREFFAPQSRLDFDAVIAAYNPTESMGKPDTSMVAGRTTELVAQRKDGTDVVVEISLSTTSFGGRQGGIGILRDITQRKADAAKLIFANTLLKSEMEASHSGILVVDADRQVVVFNKRFVDIWKLPADRLLGVTLGELIVLAKPLLTDPEKFSAGISRLLGHPNLDSSEEYALTDGRILNRDILRLSGPDGTYLGRVAYFNDVTADRNAARKLQFANLLLKTQMEASLDGILIVDAEMKIIAFNQRFSDMWKIPLAQLEKGDDTPVLASVLSQVKDQAAYSAGVAHLYANPDLIRHDEFEMSDGRCITRDALPLFADGRYLGRAWFFRDVTESKQAAAYALKMARYDVLTGLANRAVFVEALQHAIATAKRGGSNFAVIYLDLDHFKDVNDTLGHPVGDELLKQVARTLTTTTRETDTVARFGGDEFAVVVTMIDDPADAAVLAKKLIAALAMPFHVQGSELHTGASIGIATYGADAGDAETLLSHADVALYRAKAEGRGSYRFFTEAMDVEVQSRVRLGGELRDAIDTAQIFLMYQPQVLIGTSRIIGVEALMRWQHPERGLLAPDLFIPIAEKIGLIGRLGHWALWAACRQGRIWLDAGITPVRIAVNVSALQFRAPIALEADVAAALEETRLPPHLLELELTESVMMGVTREHSDVLERLRALGVKIAIDDFGTGYSSLEYLRRFPANRIKIAQIFVKELETNLDDAAIVKATIGLARELGAAVIAEGIETVAQATLIAGWGCTEAQGYLFSKPLTTEAATAVLTRNLVAFRMPNQQPAAVAGGR